MARVVLYIYVSIAFAELATSFENDDRHYLWRNKIRGMDQWNNIYQPREKAYNELFERHLENYHFSNNREISAFEEKLRNILNQDNVAHKTPTEWYVTRGEKMSKLQPLQLEIKKSPEGKELTSFNRASTTLHDAPFTELPINASTDKKQDGSVELKVSRNSTNPSSSRKIKKDSGSGEYIETEVPKTPQPSTTPNATDSETTLVSSTGSNFQVNNSTNMISPMEEAKLTENLNLTTESKAHLISTVEIESKANDSFKDDGLSSAEMIDDSNQSTGTEVSSTAPPQTRKNKETKSTTDQKIYQSSTTEETKLQEKGSQADEAASMRTSREETTSINETPAIQTPTTRDTESTEKSDSSVTNGIGNKNSKEMETKSAENISSIATDRDTDQDLTTMKQIPTEIIDPFPEDTEENYSLPIESKTTQVSTPPEVENESKVITTPKETKQPSKTKSLKDQTKLSTVPTKTEKSVSTGPEANILANEEGHTIKNPSIHLAKLILSGIFLAIALVAAAALAYHTIKMRNSNVQYDQITLLP